MLLRLGSALRDYVIMVRSERRARKLGLRGDRFVRFGHRIAWQLLRRGKGRYFLEIGLPPVISLRHFEFEYAWENVPKQQGEYLDIGSPRLFTLLVASDQPNSSFALWNPDPDDERMSAELIEVMRLKNVRTSCTPAAALRTTNQLFDAVWSLSVIEHIGGSAYTDSDAINDMWRAVKPGGRLILTFPVAPTMFEEYRPEPEYPTQPFIPGMGFFFQRWYDEPAIQERLLASLPRPDHVRWFGERDPGVYEQYQARLSKFGRAERVRDALFITETFGEFDRWKDMPGIGVCGMTVRKPRGLASPTTLT